MTNCTYIGKSFDFEHVYIYQKKDKSIIYKSVVGKKTGYFLTEREAAIEADKVLISENKEPVNILVRKN